MYYCAGVLMSSVLFLLSFTILFNILYAFLDSSCLKWGFQRTLQALSWLAKLTWSSCFWVIIKSSLSLIPMCISWEIKLCVDIMKFYCSITEYLILNISLIHFKYWGEKASKKDSRRYINTLISSRKHYKGENVQQCKIKLLHYLSAVNDSN